MNRWYKAIILIALILIVVVPLAKYVMSSDQQHNIANYRVEQVTPKYSKLRLSGETLRKLDREEPLVATIKVSQKGYVPSGVEIRARISPLIFTANIPYEILERLEQDPAVVAIEPVSNLRSY